MISAENWVRLKNEAPLLSWARVRKIVSYPCRKYRKRYAGTQRCIIRRLMESLRIHILVLCSVKAIFRKQVSVSSMQRVVCHPRYMPDLQEVETVRRGLSTLIIGKTISDVSHDTDKGFPNAPHDMTVFMKGASIKDVRR